MKHLGARCFFFVLWSFFNWDDGGFLFIVGLGFYGPVLAIYCRDRGIYCPIFQAYCPTANRYCPLSFFYCPAPGFVDFTMKKVEKGYCNIGYLP